MGAKKSRRAGRIRGENQSSIDLLALSSLPNIERLEVEFGGGGVAIDIGTSVSPGNLVLEAGLVQFEFYHGAVVVVEGPAELELLDANRVVCKQGKLRALVPQQAQGFTVLSSQFELVDLGTEFGVNVASDGSASIPVRPATRSGPC